MTKVTYTSLTVKPALGSKCPRCQRRYSPEYEHTHCAHPCNQLLIQDVPMRLTAAIHKGKPSGTSAEANERNRPNHMAKKPPTPRTS